MRNIEDIEKFKNPLGSKLKNGNIAYFGNFF